MVTIMSFYIKASEIGNCGLVSKRPFFEDQELFSAAMAAKIFLASVIQSQLKWHIQAIVIACIFGLASAQVMD